MNATPLVAIQCMTYNHAPYIEDAMNGFCMQQTDFPFVAIIVDDASTDGEPDVIKRYLDQHFDMLNARQWETDEAHFIEAQHLENKGCWFVVILLKHNYYQQHKSKMPLYSKWYEDVKYIAMCEGDDYWTAGNKLQKQVKFLELNTSCKLCFCKVKRYNQTQRIFSGTWGKDISTLDEAMTAENAIPTLTICYDKIEYNHFLKEFNPDKYHWHLGDLPLFLWFAHHGGIHFINEIVGVYRVLDESASHSKNPSKQEIFLTDVMNIKLLFDQKYNQSRRSVEIADIFMRKFMMLYAYSFHSPQKMISSFAKIHQKTWNDYKMLLRCFIVSLIRS